MDLGSQRLVVRDRDLENNHDMTLNDILYLLHCSFGVSKYPYMYCFPLPVGFSPLQLFRPLYHNPPTYQDPL